MKCAEAFSIESIEGSHTSRFYEEKPLDPLRFVPY